MVFVWSSSLTTFLMLVKAIAEPISEVEREGISKLKFARKRESKSRYGVNLFNLWLGNRQENYENWNDIRKNQGDVLTIDY